MRRASELLRTWQIVFVAPNASSCARASISCPRTDEVVDNTKLIESLRTMVAFS